MKDPYLIQYAERERILSVEERDRIITKLQDPALKARMTEQSYHFWRTVNKPEPKYRQKYFPSLPQEVPESHLVMFRRWRRQQYT